MKEMTVELKKVEGYKIVTLPGGVELKLVRIKAGSFMMGSNDGDSDEKPVHKVTLTKDFWLGETEVTQAQYKAVMGMNPSGFKKGGDYPVESVSWDDAMEFCRKLTELERAAGRLPSGYEYTLPTEAQWEYAAHGGNKSRGYQYSGSDIMDEVGWYWENSNKSTHSVKEKNPNELGLYDMSGNVKEWCSDWYGSYRAGAVTDPLCHIGSWRVFRGGSWDNQAAYCRSAYRLSYDPSFRNFNLGFRVALVTIDSAMSASSQLVVPTVPETKATLNYFCLS